MFRISNPPHEELFGIVYDFDRYRKSMYRVPRIHVNRKTYRRRGNHSSERYAGLLAASVRNAHRTHPREIIKMYY